MLFAFIFNHFYDVLIIIGVCLAIGVIGDAFATYRD